MAANLALYRKYRSASFAEVIGQDHVAAPLRHALANGRINHAYLFSGPRGCGKTSSARILARSLNCAQGPTPEPCGECDSCVELAPNGPGSIDVIEIDAASHGGVDDARDLRERAFFAPVRDRYKVYIIDEAHMVTTQGFNALLKLVEEPPEFLVFVFATTEPDKVLTTIRSRTHHYPFRLIAPHTLRAHLEAICAAEGIVVEAPVLPLVVRSSGGSARDALSLLDQLLAGAGPEGVTYPRAVALLGVTDHALLDDMVDALAASDAAGVYGTVDRIVEAGHDPRRFAADLLDRFRDLILLEAVPDAAARGLIDAPQDQLVQMSGQGGRLGAATLTRYAEIVHTALLEMRGTTSPRLVLELLCARMQLPDAAADGAALLQRLERLERRNSLAGQPADAAPAPPGPAAGEPASERPVAAAGGRGTQRRPAAGTTDPATPTSPGTTSQGATAAGTGAGAAGAEPQTSAERVGQTSSWPAARPAGGSDAASDAPSEPSQVPVADAPSPPPSQRGQPGPPSQPGQLDAAALRRLWPEVLEIIKRSSRTTWAMLDGAQITTAVGEQVTLEVAASLARRIAEERNISLVGAALTTVVGGAWQLTVVGADNAAAAGAAREAREPGRLAPARPSEPDPREDTELDQNASSRAAADPDT
ncbi:MAG: DNA polymerase III subunit gamma and tau [Jatrophihabitantaceae bacterium]